MICCTNRNLHINNCSSVNIKLWESPPNTGKTVTNSLLLCKTESLTTYLHFWDESAWSLSHWSGDPNSKFLEKNVTLQYLEFLVINISAVALRAINALPLKQNCPCISEVQSVEMFCPCFITSHTCLQCTILLPLKTMKPGSVKNLVLHKVLGKGSRTRSSVHSC